MAGARALGLGAGVVFKPATTVEDAVAASEGADLVLCMSIEPGYSGQEFMPEAVDRIARLRSLLPDDAGAGGRRDRRGDDPHRPRRAPTSWSRAARSSGATTRRMRTGSLGAV